MARPFFRPQVEQLPSRMLLSVLELHAGDNLQAAINNAQPGDTLVLDAGATFTGPITLPNKPGNQWITIESSALDQLPPGGQRVGPDDAQYMPMITSPGSGAAALQTAAGAHHYRFLGIEFLPATDSAEVFDLIDFGDGSSAQASLAQVPHDLILDQCYVHAWPDQPVKRGIALNSANTAILNSYIAGFKIDGQDSQAIAGWNGPGPFKIDNNYLEAAGENILFGGAAASIPNLVPSDIEISGNLVTKPLAWDIYDPADYAGDHWTVKNLLELKNAQRVSIDHNDFENNWVDGQNGVAIVFTPRGAQSGGPWTVVRNVTFTNNVVSNSTQGITILGSDDSSPSQVTQNILIQDNEFNDVASRSPGWGDNGGPPKLFQLLSGLAGGTVGVTIDHNVATVSQVILLAEGVHTGFAFTNNVAPQGEYGVIASGLEGTAGLNKAFPGYTFQGNTIIDATPGKYPAGNFYGTDSDEQFLIQLYADFLQRPVDPTGMASWMAALCQGVSHTLVAQVIQSSREFLTIEVNNLYETFLRRAADPAGLQIFVNFLAQGGTVEQVAAILIGSDEYYQNEAGGTDDGFRDAVYQDILGRPVDDDGRGGFDEAIASGVTREQIATAMFSSLEYREDLVAGLYQRYLRRDADGGGLDAFVNLLNQGCRDEEIVATIAGSAEYADAQWNQV